MKMFLALILILCLTMASGTITIAEEAMDFSSYSDADLLELLARGRVVGVDGEGEAQKVTVDFGERGVRTFSASIAPIIKVET